jgi:deoxyribodipyrimidine photo-lyase
MGAGDDDKKKKVKPEAAAAAATPGRPKRAAATAAAGTYAGADSDGTTTSTSSSSGGGTSTSSDDDGAVGGKGGSAMKKKAPPAKKKAKKEPAAAAGGGGGGGGTSSSDSSDDDDEDGNATTNRQSMPLRVDPRRVRALNSAGPPPSPGPVIYWMSRDQRADDNWALLHALELAAARGAAAVPVAVAFCLVPAFLGAGARQFGFMLRGLRELEAKLRARGVGFFLLRSDDPGKAVAELAAACEASALVTDYSPLRPGRQWRERAAALLAAGVAAPAAPAAAAAAAAAASAPSSASDPPPSSRPHHRCPVLEVDAHNVVPVWVASDKREYAARTIRPKIHRHLPDFLREFPLLPAQVSPSWPSSASSLPTPPTTDWDALLREVLQRGADVPEVAWARPGETSARAALDGPGGFLDPARLALYDSKRNDPGVPSALSGLSPWLHFGQLAPQRAALEAWARRRGPRRAAVDSFLEELVVRRELSDNHCHHCPDNYDALSCCSQWALDTLRVHSTDPREKNYARAVLEKGETHDDLWNAAQKEMVVTGKMHGFMRMYWAKKILEWTDSPQRALTEAIYLNDRWSLDGRDPNGYVGVLWSVGGIHDMGWAERPVFGKIRYMNYAGCKRKFDIGRYVARVEGMVREARRDGRLPACLGGGGTGGGGPGGGGGGGAGGGGGGGAPPKKEPKKEAK